MKTEDQKGLADLLRSWKEKWPTLVHEVELPVNKDETEHVTVVIKSPENDRNVCASIENQIDKNFGQARLIAVQNCVLFNKEIVLENNFAFRAASAFIFELIPNGKARIKN